MCRRRCAECRRTFTPAPSALATQRVCGARCRAARDRELARARRARDLDGARTDERVRQVACRKRRAPAVLDRLAMHAIRIDVDGPSYRQHVAKTRAERRAAKA